MATVNRPSAAVEVVGVPSIRIVAPLWSLRPCRKTLPVILHVPGCVVGVAVGVGVFVGVGVGVGVAVDVGVGVTVGVPVVT